MNYIEEYYRQIKSGKIVVGRWVKAIYKYIVTGLKKGRFFYDEKKATKEKPYNTFLFLSE